MPLIVEKSIANLSFSLFGEPALRCFDGSDFIFRLPYLSGRIATPSAKAKLTFCVECFVESNITCEKSVALRWRGAEWYYSIEQIRISSNGADILSKTAERPS